MAGGFEINEKALGLGVSLNNTGKNAGGQPGDITAAHYIDRPLSVYRFNGAGSWTSSMKDDDPAAYREKQDIYARQMREMYEGFDRATEGIFHRECVSASNRLYFLTRVNLRDFKMIFHPRFSRFYKELPARDKFFIRFEKDLPGVYKKAQKKWHREK